MNLGIQAETDRAQSIRPLQPLSKLPATILNNTAIKGDEGFSASTAFQRQPVNQNIAHSAKTILLVEDNDDLREVVKIYLSIMGFSVVDCCDAQVASTAFLSNAPFDALMSDLEMPGRSGLELARELTAICPTLPVMIVSGAFISSDMSLEMQKRNWSFLPKPCGLPSILATLEALLELQLQQAVA